MADESAKIDSNRREVMLGVVDGTEEIRMLRVDENGHLIVGGVEITIPPDVRVVNSTIEPIPVTIENASIEVNVDNAVEITNDVGNPIPVNAVNFDIRDLTSGTDSVAVTNHGGPLSVDDGGGSLTIDATSLPLPTGAATAANQATVISSLSSIDAGIPGGLGQNTMVNSMPVTLASNQSALPVTDNGGSLTVDATSWPLPTGAATAARQDTANTSLASIDAGIPAALGQDTMANSMPVAIASNQSALSVQDGGGSLTVDATSLPLPTGASTAANQTSIINALSNLPDYTGTWSYTSGTSGSPIISGGKRIIGIAAHAPNSASASMVINGGSTITIPAGSWLNWEPLAQLTDPVVSFTGTDSFIVEMVS